MPGVGRAGLPSRILAGIAGLFLLYLAPLTIGIGLAALAGSALLAAVARARRRPEEIVDQEGEACEES
ncbi:hypothetical protein Apa02nite_000120 [Actinoplanes palleronii]|uniref:Uncharacterized protein n=1 Tax=Actinoplanes palleronii TaxID=113570 RepID=A0ABQ4AZV0_9ACTN|nr:hypothetical protein Apa02nite_000120 [Actinoplanes palleronii]